MTDYLPGYDAWKTTNPDDEFLGPDPDEEEELPEPVISEVWDGGRGEYVTTVTFASGSKYTIRLSSFPADTYEIVDPQGEIVNDGYVTPERALDWLTDIEHWGC
jgi:hypothetical protein